MRPSRVPVALSALAVALVLAALVGAAGGQSASAPSFTNFQPPAPLGRDAGEPSIGANWSTGNVMYQAGLETFRVNAFNDTSGASTWTSVGSTITSTASLDPILFTDHATNRTFVSQLSAGCSLMAFSDDDGASWIQNPVGCGIASGADHQTVGGGAFAPGLSGVGYGDTVYYCAQAIATAQCALSIDGGLTFNPAVPIYTALQCGGLHGHVKSAPDGTVYVPNADCGGHAAVVASSDNGVTWAVHPVPSSTTQDESDPSVAVGSDGTLYLGWQEGASNTTGSKAYAAVSSDRGKTWTNVTNVGASLGINNVQFPSLVAGDGDRATFAFLGTTTGGNDQASSFAGVWHLYVATTYDRGATWTTVDATPSDPVQRGCIWLGGGSNICRNLLDFMDVTVGKTGRIYVGYADGCTGSCVGGGANTHSSVASIARQTSGTGLFAAYDASGFGSF
jgi:hypothetical protein